MSEQEDIEQAEDASDLVPMWLAALVLVLLLAVMGVGGYVLRSVWDRKEGGAGPVELEIRQY